MAALRAFLAAGRSLDQIDWEKTIYAYQDEEAVTHIFRVTASLDALVVGEAQILGQVKEAYGLAVSAQTVGSRLNRCMQHAFSVAKRVRTDTGIARHAASVSSVAVELAERIFDDLASVAVLVIGGGEMAELAVRHLVRQGATRLRVMNRTPERAAALANNLGGTAVAFDQLAEQLAWADIVFTSTASPEPLIDRSLLVQVGRQRKRRPLFLVDIAVPRNVDRGARGLSNVYLFDVDDLEQVVAANVRARREEAKEAERIVGEEMETFLARQRSLEAAPLIKQLRQHFLAVAQAEAERNGTSLPDDPSRKRLNELARLIVNKLLHTPTVRLKEAASRANGVPLAQATRVLFDLDPDSERGGTGEAETARYEKVTPRRRRVG